MEPIVYSLIIPVFKNEKFVHELAEAALYLDESLSMPFEIVFVIDGSPDRSYEILSQKFSSLDVNYTIVRHTRNFGSFAAVRTGLNHATGKFFAVMAADMQEPVSFVKDAFATLATDQFDIVVGTRDSRKDPLFSSIGSKIFWWCYKRFVNPEIPKGGVDVFGCNLEVRNKILSLQEAHSSLIALLFWIGYRRQLISYDRLERKYGQSGWTFWKKVKYLSDSVFSFTDLPIRMLFGLGTLGLVFSILLGAVSFVGKVTGLITVPGYTTSILVLSFFTATNLFSLAIIGSYVWRAFENTKQRPNAIEHDQKTVSRKSQRIGERGLSVYSDSRGTLTFGQINQNLPFIVQRYFLIQNVPPDQVRGDHAHRECHQFVTCVHGKVEITTENYAGKRTYSLDNSSQGIYLPPLSWCLLKNFSSDACVLVLASHIYDKSDYIHSYAEFSEILASASKRSKA